MEPVRTSRISAPGPARSCPLRAAGNVVPQQDCDFLKARSVAAVCGPGADIPKAAGEVLRPIQAGRKMAAE